MTANPFNKALSYTGKTEKQVIAWHKAMELDLKVNKLPIAAKYNRKREELHQKISQLMAIFHG